MKGKWYRKGREPLQRMRSIILFLIMSSLALHGEDITLTITPSTNVIFLTWKSIAGATYTIEENTLLSTSGWRRGTMVVGTGEVMTNSFTVGRVKIFYRINERPNPLYAKKFFIDPDSRAKRQADSYRIDFPDKAALMDKIACEPQGMWFNGREVDLASSVSAIINLARVSNSLPVFVAYNIPKRDCASYSGGGAVSKDAYITWCRTFAQSISTNEAIVILEPDALSRMDCLTSDEQTGRCDMLKEAVHIFKTESKAYIYIDAGHNNWIDVNTMARRLQNAGIDEAQGFSLNVSNFYYDSDIIRFGTSLSRLLNSIHFVIDTSRNGKGPITDPSFENPWCNPPMRALGKQVTSTPNEPLLDAFLWIKKPGESDGDCREGEPPAGAWWPEYALGLAERALY